MFHHVRSADLHLLPLSRSMLLCGVLLILLPLAIACGGDDDGDDTNEAQETATPVATTVATETAEPASPTTAATEATPTTPATMATDATPDEASPTAASTGSPTGGSPTTDASPGTAVLIPVAGEVEATIPVGVEPFALTSGEGAVWVPNLLDNTLSRIDPATNAVVATIQIGEPIAPGEPGPPMAVVVGDGYVWATQNNLPQVLKIDPATNEVVATIDIGVAPHLMAFSPGALWISTALNGSVVRVDTATDQVVTTIPVEPVAFGIAAREDGVWVANRGADKVTRIDPATNEVVAVIDLVWEDAPATDPNCGLCATFMMADENGVWVSLVMGAVVRIDPATDEVAAIIPVPAGPAGMVSTEDGVWLTLITFPGMNPQPGLVLIDPESNTMVGQVPQTPVFIGVTELDGDLWASAIDDDTVYRISPAQ